MVKPASVMSVTPITSTVAAVVVPTRVVWAAPQPTMDTPLSSTPCSVAAKSTAAVSL